MLDITERTFYEKSVGVPSFVLLQSIASKLIIFILRSRIGLFTRLSHLYCPFFEFLILIFKIERANR